MSSHFTHPLHTKLGPTCASMLHPIKSQPRLITLTQVGKAEPLQTAEPPHWIDRSEIALVHNKVIYLREADNSLINF